MRTKGVGFALLLGAGWLFGITVPLSQAQSGPEDGGAVLRNPFDEPAPRTAPRPKAAGQTGTPAAASADTVGSSTLDRILANLTVDPRYAINKDIQPTPDLGPWMICVHSYVTKEAPDWARQMAGELRSNPKYRLPAYVFTYGLEERHKEYLRVKGMLDKQRDFAKEMGLPIMVAPNAKRGPAHKIEEHLSFDQMLSLVGSGGPDAMESDDLPLQYALGLLKVKHIQVQCAILVGGYANDDAAHRALANIRNLPPPDPNRVKLDIKFYGDDEDAARPGKLKKDSGEGVSVNPFKRAFVCRNPSIKQERGPEQDGLDVKVLRKLNQDEPLTLLNCQKPITLAIKQFQTFTTIESKGEAPSLLDKFGFKTRSGEGVDQAAHDGHSLAEFLRKKQLEAYVLHTKFSSIVTVGGYDSLDDPSLRAMQSALSERLRAIESNLRIENRPNSAPINMMFFPRPMPMKVPH